jgi:hypothetical protein
VIALRSARRRATTSTWVADESEESQVQREDFLAAYDRLLARWPGPLEDVDLTSEFGRARVHVSGPVDAPAIVLFHAYQATSAEWVELARLLASGGSTPST